MDLLSFYRQRMETRAREIAALRQKKKRFAAARLLSFLAAVIVFFVLLSSSPLAAAASAVLLLAVFVFVALRDLDNSRLLRLRSELLEINRQELASLDQDLEPFAGGEAFKPRNHDYEKDLDIIGAHSLYRLMNRTTAWLAEKGLAERLLKPVETDRLPGIHEAVRELAQEVDWRHELRARGRLQPVTETAFRQIDDWSAKTEPLPRMLGVVTVLLPALSLLAVLSAWAGWVPWKILWLFFAAHLLVLWRTEKATTARYNAFSEAMKVMEGLKDVLGVITAKTFHAPLLRELYAQCTEEGLPAPLVLARLNRILARLDLRLNPLVHFPLNLLLFWDWHQHRLLLRWKQQHPGSLPRWISAHGELEVLASLANLSFNHPAWAFAEIREGDFVCRAKALGHPLVPPGVRVCNDLDMEGPGILLVTGSNMAGKSTFLRTVGVNMVLAFAGAPVCAEALVLSPVKVLSSMRVQDNLEEHVSTFYAELTKLEHILKKVRAHEPVFLLLDEVLRGTNSLDRHAGARALILALLKEGAPGIVATHDLDLTGMEKEFPGKLSNAHFDVEVRGEELYFDYRLRPGICTSMNASILMRKIGIEV